MHGAPRRKPLLRSLVRGSSVLPLAAAFAVVTAGTAAAASTPGGVLNLTVANGGSDFGSGGTTLAVSWNAPRNGSVDHIVPEGLTPEAVTDYLEQKAKAAVLVIRLDPSLLDPAATEGSYEGIVAYSKICTHMGCPVALYEQQTHHLLRPCHQSTFDVTQNCKVIFGPAKRPLPQLPITVDADGYLVAKSGFHQAVGPSFWERG